MRARASGAPSVLNARPAIEPVARREPPPPERPPPPRHSTPARPASPPGATPPAGAPPPPIPVTALRQRRMEPRPGTRLRTTPAEPRPAAGETWGYHMPRQEPVAV